MDIQRSILIVALAVVSYLMVLQWNKDYGQPVMPTAQTTTSTPASTLPDTTAAGQASADVPPASTEGAVVPQASVSTNTTLINVKTDVLTLAIDPLGGDVVQLSLPKFPRSLQYKDVPFQLFDNGNERTYLAQSGLTGANGPDARSTGRPLYSSEANSYSLNEGKRPVGG